MTLVEQIQIVIDDIRTTKDDIPKHKVETLIDDVEHLIKKLYAFEGDVNTTSMRMDRIYSEFHKII